MLYLLHNRIKKYVIMGVKNDNQNIDNGLLFVIKTVNVTLLCIVVSQQFDKHLNI